MLVGAYVSTQGSTCYTLTLECVRISGLVDFSMRLLCPLSHPFLPGDIGPYNYCKLGHIQPILNKTKSEPVDLVHFR